MRKLGLVMLVLVLAVAGLGIYLELSFPPQRLRELAEPRLEAALGHPVELGGASLHLSPLAVRLDSLRVLAPVGSTHPDLLRIGTLSLRLRTLPLLRRQVVVTSLEIRSPEVWLEERGDRVWNATPPADATTPRAPAASQVDLTIEDLHLVQGRVHFYSSVSDVGLELPLEARLRLAFDRKLEKVRISGWIESDPVSGGERGNLRLLRDVRLRLEPDITLDVPDSSATIERLRCFLNEAQVDLTGEARRVRGEPELHLRTQTPSIDVAKLLATVPRGAVPVHQLQATGQLQLDVRIDQEAGEAPLARGTVQLDAASLQFQGLPEKLERVSARVELLGDSLRVQEASATLAGAPIQVTGLVVDASRPERTRYDLRVQAAADLARIAGFAPLPAGTTLGGRAEIDIQASGRSARPDSVWIVGPIALRGVVVRTPALRQEVHVEAQLQGTGERLRIESSSLRTGSSELRATGSLRPALPPQRPSIDLAAVAKRLDLEELLPKPEVATGSGGAGGPAPPPLVPQLAPLDLRASLDCEELLFTGTRVQKARLDLHGDGEALRASLRAAELQSSDVVLYAVTAELEARDAAASGKVKSDRARMKVIQATALESDIAIRGTEMHFANVRGKAYDGALLGEARVDLSNLAAPRYDMQVRAEKVDANTFLGSVTPLRGVVFGKLDLESTWKATGPTPASVRSSLSASGQGTTFEGRLRELPLLSQLAAWFRLPSLADLDFRDLGFRFQIADGRMHLRDMALHGKSADVDVDGSIGLGGDLDLGMRVLLSEEVGKRYLRGQALATLGSMFADPNGRLVFDFDVTGNHRQPKLTADLSATSARAGLTKLTESALQKYLGGVSPVPIPNAGTISETGRAAADETVRAAEEAARRAQQEAQEKIAAEAKKKLGGKLGGLLRGDKKSDGATPGSASQDSTPQP